MNVISLLAQTATTPPPQSSPDALRQFLIDPSYQEKLWTTIEKLPWIHAVICIAFACIYLIYGWRIFRMLVIINGAMLGLFVGNYIGSRWTFEGASLFSGLIGAALGGIAAWTFMKYMVSLLGAVAGALLGAAIWQGATLPSELLWAGGLAGLVAGGFLAFSSYKFSIMLFSSLQGALLLTIGVLSLFRHSPAIDPEQFKSMIFGQVFVLPAMLIVPTLFGILLQKKMLKENKNWTLPDKEGFNRN